MRAAQLASLVLPVSVRGQALVGSIPSTLTSECALGCVQNLTSAQDSVSLNHLCSDMARQRALFLCLQVECEASSYGSALADVALTCSDLGASIGTLHPVEILRPHLTTRSIPGYIYYGSQAPGAPNTGANPGAPADISCNAGSDGVLTLSPSNGATATPTGNTSPDKSDGNALADDPSTGSQGSCSGDCSQPDAGPGGAVGSTSPTGSSSPDKDTGNASANGPSTGPQDSSSDDCASVPGEAPISTIPTGNASPDQGPGDASGDGSSTGPQDPSTADCSEPDSGSGDAADPTNSARSTSPDQGTGNPPASNPPAGNPPASNPPASNPPAGSQPVGSQPAGSQPAGSQPAGSQPAGDPSTSNLPVDGTSTGPQNPSSDDCPPSGSNSGNAADSANDSSRSGSLPKGMSNGEPEDCEDNGPSSGDNSGDAQSPDAGQGSSASSSTGSGNGASGSSPVSDSPPQPPASVNPSPSGTDGAPSGGSEVPVGASNGVPSAEGQGVGSPAITTVVSTIVVAPATSATAAPSPSTVVVPVTVAAQTTQAMSASLVTPESQSLPSESHSFVKAKPPSGWVPVSTTAVDGSPSEVTLWPGAGPTFNPDSTEQGDGNGPALLRVTVIAPDGGNGAMTTVMTVSNNDLSWPSNIPHVIGDAQSYARNKKRMIQARHAEESSIESEKPSFQQPAESTGTDPSQPTVGNGGIEVQVSPFKCTCMLVLLVGLFL